MATIRCWKLALRASIVMLGCGALVAQQAQHLPLSKPAQDAQRFLAQRSLDRIGGLSAAELLRRAREEDRALAAADSGTTPLNAPWVSLGPSAVATANYGLISGRITSIAADPSNANVVYAGTTGGGIWKSMDATSSSPTFAPLTDALVTSEDCAAPTLASLSIGALTVQPGGTGVILAGTGDPNDSLDSYYGTGILRSEDNGSTWCLIPNSMDAFYGALRGFSFSGLGFAGFAWSTANPHLVVAAVAQSAEGEAVNAGSASSFAGLYYSSNDGKTWLLATIEDGPQKIIQSAQGASTGDPGNSATSVTWNPVRNKFYATIRYHGYYESPDGVTWTRLANQPSPSKLFAGQCPANPGGVGSPACPILRGTITAQPVTGDLFALTVDNTNSDQGLWQDVCNANNGGCASATVTFSQQIQDAAIDAGAGTVIPQGDYDLSLAAVPSLGDTLLFVGTRDIFRCSLLNNCAWRNTTNVDGCAAGKVAPSQHVFETTFAANGVMYFGNDGGLWRTGDAVNQQQPACSQDDSSHFQNLNGGFTGSLAEITNFSEHPQDRNVLMAGMGAFGTAAMQAGSSSWAQVLDGEGDGNAIDPAHPQNWYATSAAPVSINLCTQGTACDKASFGSPVIGNSQVGNDGYGLTGIAPWILDPQDTANLIVGTCRIWRGPAANGSAWNANSAVSAPLDNVNNAYCNGNAQIRSLAASGSPSDPVGTAENIYAGMAGRIDGGATVAGHVYSASVNNLSGVMPSWSDQTGSQVINSPLVPFNAGGFDISSIYADPHASNTIYVTVQGFVPGGGSEIYRSVDGGGHWIAISANLPTAPANSVMVDPNDANTVYVALDTGVYVTRNINQCTDSSQNCWSALGTGLPEAPVMQLRAYNYLTTSLLRAATYGRGIWEIPLVTSGVATTAASLTPSTLTFASQQANTLSSAQTVTLENTGTVTLTISSIAASQNFAEQDNCTQPLLPGGSCSVLVSFAPTVTGPLQGALTVYANVPGGQLTATLSGTGLAAGNIVLLPGSLNFGSSLTGKATPAQNITISNIGGVNVGLQGPRITGDFQISANTCGTSLPPNTGCTVSVTFTPSSAGGRVGVFSISDDEETQTVQLSGTGQAAATAVLSGTSLNFSQPQTIGTKSAPQQIILTNNGDVSLTDIVIGVNGDFTAQNSCGSYLIGHASCAISIVFVPSKVGAETGVLTVNTQLGAQTVSLTGTGQAPSGISALPAMLDFGSQAVNSTSSAQKVVLTNSSSAPLDGLTFVVDGNFAVSGGSCVSGGTLNAQSGCDLNLTFTPAQTGTLQGSLKVGSANLGSPLNVSLSGIGEDFQLTVSGPSSAVIVPGQTATYNLQVIPVSGSTGALTLGCSGAPQNAVCKMNPSTLPIASGVTGFATVTVTTTAASASALPGSRWHSFGIVFAALLPCAFLGMRKRRLLLRCWFCCLLTAALLLAPVACGVHATGGGTTGSPGPGGSSSVYTLTITGSIPGLQRSIPLTLTVQ